MAAKTTLNEKNLTTLGPERLAALVMELVMGNAALKRQARAALLENAGGDALASEVRKRISTIKRSTSWVDWQKQRALAKDLDQQRATIVDKIAPKDPKAALELMWRFLELAESVHARVDDSNGTVGAIFGQACADLGSIMDAAKPDPKALADQVSWAVIGQNDYGQYDGLIAYATPALGETGLGHLKARLIEAGEALGKKRPEPGEGKVIGWGSSGPVHSAAYEYDAQQRTIRSALQNIADAQGDVDAFIAGYDAETRTVPAIAAEIANRLLTAGRVEEALAVLEKTESETRWIPREWLDTHLATLDALERYEAAQALRWDQFQTNLSAEDLRAYLKRLPDFEEVETEERALDHARNFPNLHDALTFLVNWPALDRAASLVLEKSAEWDGNIYFLLSPAADALEGKHPLAATILRRAMILDTLGSAKSSRYKHAARHLLECESNDSVIEDYGRQPSHAEFVAALRERHARKFGFWSLLQPD